MEKLKEEDDEMLPQQGSVKLPARGKDYVVLPTSDKPAEDPVNRQRRKKLLIIGGILVALLLIIIIVLCIVLLNKPKAKTDDDKELAPEDLSGRLDCSLAGFSPTEEECRNAECQYHKKSKHSSEPRCVYEEGNQYYVSSKEESENTVKLQLHLRTEEDSDKAISKRDLNFDYNHGANVTNVLIATNETDTDALVDTTLLPKLVHVTITLMSNSSLTIQVGLREHSSSPPPAEQYSPAYNLTLPGVGEEFFVLLARRDTGEAIFDTRSLPLVLTENLVEFAGAGSDKIYSNSRWIDTAEDSIVVWNSPENSNLPYLYGCDEAGRFYGVASNNPGPSKIAFSKNSIGKSVARFTMLGGNVDMTFFMGPLLADVAKQVTDAFGKAYNPPYWSLGTIVHHNAGAPLEAHQYPVDVLMFSGFVADPDDSQTINHHIRAVFPVTKMPHGPNANPTVKRPDGEIFMGKIEEGLEFAGPGDHVAYLDFSGDLETFPYEREGEGDGFNLLLNYPFNYMDTCQNNTANISPHAKLLETPLYKETLCLDYVHNSGLHKMIHNKYGTLQARALAGFQEDAMFLMSDSVSLGAGQYTAKTVYVSTEQDLMQVVPSVLWYNHVGMHVVSRISEEVEDEELITKYHKLITFLPFTSADEKALSRLDNITHAELLKFTAQKYHFYPEWLAGFHKSSQLGEPLVRSMEYNYPDNKFLKTDMFRDNFNQFMIGEKIIVAFGPVVGTDDKVSVYFPRDDRCTDACSETGWYSRVRKRATDKHFVFNKTQLHDDGVVNIVDPAAEQHYFVRAGSIVVMSRQLSEYELTRGNLIDTTQATDLVVHCLLDDYGNDDITESYFLVVVHNSCIGQQCIYTGQSSITVEISLSRNETGITLDIIPSIHANTDLGIDSISVYGLDRAIREIYANGEPLNAISYSTDGNLLRLNSIDGSERLDKDYRIHIQYVDVN